jgi:DNA-binding response OmpR family regulator
MSLVWSTGEATKGHGPSPEPARPTVLLLDDQPSVRASLGRHLQSAGYQVLPAADADNAFRMLGRSSIDVAILDVRLPDHRSGLEVLEFVRLDEERYDLPVIILTGVELNGEEEEIVRRHRAYVFYKPHGYKEVVHHLNQLLHHHSARE